MKFNTYMKFFAKDPGEPTGDDDGGLNDFIDFVDGKGDTGDDPSSDDPADDPGDPGEGDDPIEPDPEGDPDGDDDPSDDPDDDPEPGDDPDPDDPDSDPDEPEVTELDELKLQNQKLMSLLEKTIKKEDEPEPEPEVELQDEATFKNVVKALDLDDDESKVFGAFVEKLVERTQKSTLEQVIATTPEIVGKVVDNKTRANAAKDNFYKDNPALGEVKTYVAQVARGIAKENSSLSIEEVLETTAKRAYKALGIKKVKAEDVDSDDKPGNGKKKKKPAFAKTKGSRKQPKTRGKLETEIDDMLALDE